MRRRDVAGAALGGAGIAAAAVLVAARRWRRETARLVRRLDASVDAAAATARAMDDALPPPVRRYLALALGDRSSAIRRARLEHEGTFDAGSGWRPFRSVQQVAVRPSGFVWDATIRVAPLVRMRVRDAYLDGEGSMLGALAGLVPVVEQRGTPAIAEGSLQRWLAEAPWFPTALLPGAGVRWRAIDDRSSEAAIDDHGVRTAVVFHFGDDGLIARMTARRWRDVRGTPVLTEWEGTHRDYRRIAGLLVPTDGEVAWRVDGRLAPYWRARMVRAEYEG